MGVTVFGLESGSPGQGGIRDPVSSTARGQNRGVLGNVLGRISTTSLGPVYPVVSVNTEGLHTLPSMDGAEWDIKQATNRGFWGVSNRNYIRETRNCLSQNKLFLGLPESWPKGPVSLQHYQGSIPPRLPSGLAILEHFLLLVSGREPEALSNASRKNRCSGRVPGDPLCCNPGHRDTASAWRQRKGFSHGKHGIHLQEEKIRQMS